MSIPQQICINCKGHIWLYQTKCNLCGVDLQKRSLIESEKHSGNLEISYPKETYVYSEINQINKETKDSPWGVVLNILGGIIIIIFLFWIVYLTDFILYFTILFFSLMGFGVLYEIFKKKPQTESGLNISKNASRQNVVEKREYVYILSNVSMPGLIKIGRTNRSVDERLKELNNTSLPTQFIVEHTIKTSDSKFLEKMVHKNFEKHRVNDNREFFRINHEVVIKYAESINNVLK
jgi:hypothetical protein